MKKRDNGEVLQKADKWQERNETEENYSITDQSTGIIAVRCSTFPDFTGIVEGVLEEEAGTRYSFELDKENALTLKDLRIDGSKLQKLGIPKGPIIGKILNELLEEVIDNPELNNEEYLKERSLSLFRGQSQ